MQAHTTDYIKGSCTQFNLHVENIQMSVTQPPQLKMSFNWGGCVQQRVGENAVSVHVASLAPSPSTDNKRKVVQAHCDGVSEQITSLPCTPRTPTPGVPLCAVSGCTGTCERWCLQHALQRHKTGSRKAPLAKFHFLTRTQSCWMSRSTCTAWTTHRDPPRSGPR